VGTGGPYLEIVLGDFQRILDRLPGAGVSWLCLIQPGL